jgi:hypothetical protein
MILLDALFILRLIPLMVGGFVATKHRDYIAITICFLYICVTTVNYWFANPALNAIFSTPLVFLTAWYIIKRNRRKA